MATRRRDKYNKFRRERYHKENPNAIYLEHLTEEEKLKTFVLAKCGYSQTHIAKVIGKNIGTIKRFCKKENIHISKRLNPLTREELTEALIRIRNGEHLFEVALDTGISVPIIYRLYNIMDDIDWYDSRAELPTNIARYLDEENLEFNF